MHNNKLSNLYSTEYSFAQIMDSNVACIEEMRNAKEMAHIRVQSGLLKYAKEL